MKGIFEKNKGLSLVIAIQILAVLILVLCSLGGRKNITLSGDKLMKGEGRAPLVSIKSGCYDVNIEYESTQDSENVIVGVLKAKSTRNKEAVKLADVNLVGGKTQVSTKAWISFGSKMSDMQLRVVDKKNGLTTVNKVTLKENLIWRVTRVLKLILIFACIDLFLLLLFSNTKYALPLNKKYVFLALLSICIFSSLPLFVGKIIKGDDLEFHLSRIAAITEGLKAGQFPVRIQSEMLSGYGFATPLFYCDFFLYIPAILYYMCVPLEICYKIYAVGVNVATCLVAYYVFKKLVKNDKLAVFGSAIYVLASYRIFNLYRRASLGEYTAMIFFPIVIYGFYKILSYEDAYKPKLKDYLPIIIGLSGIILSHVLSCEIVAGFIILICLVFIKKVFRKNTFFALAKAAILTVVLNIWMLVPFLQSMTMQLKITNNGINQLQFRGLTFYDIFSLFYIGHTNEDGKFKMLTLGVALVIGVFVFIYCQMKYGKQEGKLYRLNLTTALLGVLAVFMSTKYFPWDSIQAYSRHIAAGVCTIQFPWRLLCIATVMFSFCTVLSLHILMEKEEHTFVNRTIIVTAILLVVTTGYFFTDYKMGSSSKEINTLTDIGTHSIGKGEYLPVATKRELLYKRELSTGENVTYENYSYKKGITKVTCQNASANKSSITIPLLMYDHYQARDMESGKKLSIKEGKNGLVKIVLPENYKGTVLVKYVAPFLWTIAIIISCITLAGMIAWIWFDNRRKQVV